MTKELQDWQAIRYGDSDETRLALAYYRERGWKVDDQHHKHDDLMIYSFQAGYQAALLAQPSAPVTPDRCPHCSFNPTSLNDFCDKHRPVIGPVTPEPPRQTTTDGPRRTIRLPADVSAKMLANEGAVLARRQADKLRAVADLFTECKTLTLESLPTGLIAALCDGAEALVGYHGTRPLGDSEPAGTERSAIKNTLKLSPEPPLCLCGTVMVCPDIGCDRNKVGSAPVVEGEASASPDRSEAPSVTPSDSATYGAERDTLTGPA